MIRRGVVALVIFGGMAWLLWPRADAAPPPIPEVDAIERLSIYGEVTHPAGLSFDRGSVRITIRGRRYRGGELVPRCTLETVLDPAGKWSLGLSGLDLDKDAVLQMTLRFRLPGLMPVFEERQLTPDQLPLQVQLTPEPGPGIIGRAVDTDGSPLAETRVQLGEHETWTSEEGLFAFPLDSETRRVSIRLSHPRIGVAELLDVELGAAVAVRDLGNITIDQTLGTISGRVMFSDGAPVEGLQLEFQLVAADRRSDSGAFDHVSLITDRDGRVETNALASGFYRITYADPGTEVGLARLIGEEWQVQKRTGSGPFSIKLPFARTDFRCVDSDGVRLPSVVRIAIWEGEAAGRAREVFEREATMPDSLLAQAVVLSGDFHPGRLDRAWTKPLSFIALFALNGPRFAPIHASAFVGPGTTKLDVTKTAELRTGDFGTLHLTAIDADGATISPATWRVEMARIGGIVGFSRQDQWIGNGVRTARGTATLRVVPGALKVRVMAGEGIGCAKVTVGTGETKSLSIPIVH